MPYSAYTPLVSELAFQIEVFKTPSANGSAYLQAIAPLFVSSPLPLQHDGRLRVVVGPGSVSLLPGTFQGDAMLR